MQCAEDVQTKPGPATDSDAFEVVTDRETTGATSGVIQERSLRQINPSSAKDFTIFSRRQENLKALPFR